MFVITVVSFLLPELALDDSPIECNFKGETPTDEKHVANSWQSLCISTDVSNAAISSSISVSISPSDGSSHSTTNVLTFLRHVGQHFSQVLMLNQSSFQIHANHC